MATEEKDCEVCMWLRENDKDGCKKSIFRDSTNAAGDCEFFVHREHDTLNTEKIELDKRTMVCFDGVLIWFEQKVTRIESDKLIEETVELQVDKVSIPRLKEILCHIEERMRTQ